MSARPLPLLLVAALALAGCVQPPGEVEAAAIDAPLDPLARVVAHVGDALVPVVGELEARVAHVGHPGPEPSLGVTSDGTIWITAAGADKLARSVDHGATWELVTTGDPVRAPKRSLDPWMWVDPVTDRVINAPLYVVCTWMTWSDDGGASWDFNPIAGCNQGIPAHDHQKITSGPPAEGVSTDGYPNVIYYSYNSFRGEGTWIQQSYDGGNTFTRGQAVHKDDPCHSGIAGPVAVAPDGTAYSPKPTCDGLAIAVSKDSGATWSVVDVDDVGSANALAHMVDAAVDAAGNAYAVFHGEDGLAYLTTSTDQGATWSKPVRVSPPGVTATVFGVVSAGAEGRIAVAYVGTRADASKWDEADGQSADDSARWHLFLATAENATSAAPVFTTVQVTPEDDPVQIGCIWQSGGSNPCRNLLDFIDMVERDGRVYIGFADGCDKCASADKSRGREAAVAILERGPSLAGGLLGPLAALAKDAPAPQAAGQTPQLPGSMTVV